MSLVVNPVGFHPFSTARRRLIFRIVRKNNYKRKQSWSLYIRKVKKEFGMNDITISRSALEVMDNMMNHIFQMIVTEAHHLVHINDKKTLTVKDIETAVKLLLPGELKTFAHSQGSKAVQDYKGSIGV